MKKAKQQGEIRKRQVCGECARTVKVRYAKDVVACTARLTIMPVDHAADCEDYQPLAAKDATAPEVVVASVAEIAK